MFIIKPVDPVEFYPLFRGVEPAADLPPDQWAAACKERGFLAFLAIRDEAFAGYAVAESNPKVLEILDLDGDTYTCRFLLERLVRLAGERNVSSRCPVTRTDVQKMLHWLGFAWRGVDDGQGWPCHLYSREQKV